MHNLLNPAPAKNLEEGGAGDVASAALEIAADAADDNDKTPTPFRGWITFLLFGTVVELDMEAYQSRLLSTGLDPPPGAQNNMVNGRSNSRAEAKMEADRARNNDPSGERWLSTNNRLQLVSLATSKIIVEYRNAARLRELVISNLQLKIQNIKYMIDTKKYLIDHNRSSGSDCGVLVMELMALVSALDTASNEQNTMQLAMIEDSGKRKAHEAFNYIDLTMERLVPLKNFRAEAQVDVTVPPAVSTLVADTTPHSVQTPLAMRLDNAARVPFHSLPIETPFAERNTTDDYDEVNIDCPCDGFCKCPLDITD